MSEARLLPPRHKRKADHSLTVPPILNDALYDRKQAAALLRMSPRHLSELVAEGKVTGIDGPRRQMLFLGSDLLAWVRSRRIVPSLGTEPNPCDDTK